MSDNFSFPIPNDVLEPYIKAAVSTAITAALGDGTELVGKAIQSALQQKVNGRGQKSQYESENKYNFVEVVAVEHIQEIAREVIKEMAQSMRPQIQAELEKQIAKSNKVLAKTLVEGMVNSLSCKYSVNLSINEDKQ